MGRFLGKVGVDNGLDQRRPEALRVRIPEEAKVAVGKRNSKLAGVPQAGSGERLTKFGLSNDESHAAIHVMKYTKNPRFHSVASFDWTLALDEALEDSIATGRSATQPATQCLELRAGQIGFTGQPLKSCNLQVEVFLPSK